MYNDTTKAGNRPIINGISRSLLNNISVELDLTKQRVVLPESALPVTH